jgi:hypothetical protein
MSTNFLTDYIEVTEIATDLRKCERTIIRWMNEPKGLPYVKIGNRRLVHIPTAQEWLLQRMRKPNARRGAS